MRTFLIAVAALACLAATSAPAKTVVTGDLLELHSCELYTGGCFASSEATTEGRYMVRVWNFTGGTHAGADLRGLQLAVLQVSDGNLASQGTRAVHSVIYLPKNAKQNQRDALVAWLESNEPSAVRKAAATRVVPMSFTSSAQAASFSAGDYVRVNTRPMESCDNGGCGDDLWYTPRTSTTSFSVGVARDAFINEPALSVKWSDHGKREVFSAQFGAAPGRDIGTPGLVSAAAHWTHDLSE